MPITPRLQDLTFPVCIMGTIDSNGKNQRNACTSKPVRQQLKTCTSLSSKRVTSWNRDWEAHPSPLSTLLGPPPWALKGSSKNLQQRRPRGTPVTPGGRVDRETRGCHLCSAPALMASLLCLPLPGAPLGTPSSASGLAQSPAFWPHRHQRAQHSFLGTHLFPKPRPPVLLLPHFLLQGGSLGAFYTAVLTGH